MQEAVEVSCEPIVVGLPCLGCCLYRAAPGHLRIVMADAISAMLQLRSFATAASPALQSPWSRVANAIFCRNPGGQRLRDRALAIAERTGPRPAAIAPARKLAVTLHTMWRSNTPFREVAMA